MLKLFLKHVRRIFLDTLENYLTNINNQYSYLSSLAI